MLLCSALVAAAACRQDGASPEADANAMAGNGASEGPSAATGFEYEDLCEASAAAVLDESHFAVASDDSESLAVYRRGQARPVARFEHSGVTDMEGAARIGGTIFWVTSHSLNKEGEDKPKRKVLFATTDAPGPSLADAGSPFTGLRGRIGTLLDVDDAALRPWLNIEGVASTPEGDLLLGLRRAPEGDARAYVVRIADPSALVGMTPPGPAREPASAGQVWRLDLGGRGIRSMERIEDGTSRYLILAGPRGDETADFALFWWDGASETVTPGPAVQFAGMVPEAMIAWRDGEVQFLGDNEGDGPGRCSEKADDPRPRRFPSLSLRL